LSSKPTKHKNILRGVETWDLFSGRGENTLTSADQLYLHLLKDDSLGVGSTSEGIGLPSGTQMSLLVVLVGPTLVATVVHMLPGSAQTSWLACGGPTK